MKEKDDHKNLPQSLRNKLTLLAKKKTVNKKRDYNKEQIERLLNRWK